MTLLAGRYNPSGVVLSGGQGDVIICQDKWLERDVVVKRLHTGGDIKSLEKEITARQKVTSKYLAQIYDYFIGPDGEPRLVSEYIPGEELSSTKILPVTDTDYLLRLLYQLGSGISDFHDAQVVHRDIKPHNCRLDAEGYLRVFDLGISTDLDETDYTKLGAGTPGFLAPELYVAGDKAVTPAIDVYAWGATAWFLSTGTLPKELITLPPQKNGSAPSFGSQCGNAILVDLVDRALNSNPADRPDMSSIVDSLLAELTHGQHRGLLVGPDGKQFPLDSKSSTITVGIKAKGQNIQIHYDGYGFTVAKCQGDVYVNNAPAVAGAPFPSACVVTFGAPAEGARRTYLNFASAYPEVTF